jgi:4'-phosphopantetheinyl transferase
VIEMSNVWRERAADRTLSPDRVEVWQANLDQPLIPLASLSQMLSDDEGRRAASFRFDADRDRYVACRGVLRALLGRYLDTDPEVIRFAYGSHGRPELAEPFSGSGLRFNVSHTQNLALFAFTIARSVGVDVEQVRSVPDAEQIASTLFPPRYSDLLRAAPLDQREALFFRFWTEVEALHKATGAGLAGAERGDATVTGSGLWRLEHLTPCAGFVAGLAVEGHDWELRCFRWNVGDAPGDLGRGR